MPEPRSELCSQYIKIFIVVSSYWIVSIVTVFVNKRLLSSKEVALEAPLFITWFQCVVSFLICFAFSSTGGIPKVFAFPKGTPWNVDACKKGPNSAITISSKWSTTCIIMLVFITVHAPRVMRVRRNAHLASLNTGFIFGEVPIISFDRHNIKDQVLYRIGVIFLVIPLSLMFTLMIATNNLCLKYVGVPFYYVSRSLTTVFNVVFSWLLLRQTTSYRCIGCCAFIIFGFYLGVDQENLLGSLSVIGTIYGVVGSIMLSLYSIHTKKVLPHVNQEVWLLSYYINAYSIFLFLPLIAINGELPELWNFKNIGSSFFWLQMIIGGVCGFAIGYVTSLQIKVTSPLTHNISGTAKACAQTVIATQWYQESKNVLWWTSNVIVLLSSAFYARFKQLEMVDNAKKPVPEEKRSLEDLRPEEIKLSSIQSDRQN